MLAEKALRLSRARMWSLAYRIVVQNDLATNSEKANKYWNNLDSVDVLPSLLQGEKLLRHGGGFEVYCKVLLGAQDLQC